MKLPKFSSCPSIRKLTMKISSARKRNPKTVAELIKRIELEKICFYVEELPEHKFSRELFVDLLMDWANGKAPFPHPKPRRKLI